MARKPRTESPTKLYHIYNRGIDGKNIFHTPQQKYFFLNCIRDALPKFPIEIYAYCIMHNHFHLLLKGDLKEISAFMRTIESRYGFTYNVYHNRAGYVFQNNFKSKCIVDEKYFWTVNRYIHLNPIKAGYDTTLTSYRFSSIREYLNFKLETALITPKAIILMNQVFDGLENYLDFHQEKTFVFVDDVPEDTDLQLLENTDHVLEYFQDQYKIEKWEDLRLLEKDLPEIIHLLHKQCNFNKKQISKLLGLSSYHVNFYAKKPTSLP